MSGKQRHEYELKFKIGADRSAIQDARQKLQAAGFVEGPRCIETDYLPDTSDSRCKRAGILLRFRQVQGAGRNELLVTLKVKQAAADMLHFQEYETDLHAVDEPTVAAINSVLLDCVSIQLTDGVTKSKTLEEAKNAVKALGLTKHRILLSKYRENFSQGPDNATIDYFPDGMGVYVELESHSAEALARMVEKVGFDDHEKVTDDYGDILKMHKADLEDQAQRTALFSEMELQSVDAMMRDGHA